MTTPRSDQAFGDLEQAIERIWEIARAFGLDPFPVHFELVPASVMYEFGAYGLPGRFSHWTHGRAFHQMKTMYDYGLQRIYELVINANPAYAFLLESNTVLQNKLVVAHVLGHSDCFKHNAYFGPTSRRMLDTVSASAGRFAGYEFEHGPQALEQLLDAVLSVEEYVETHPFMRREEPKREKRAAPGRGSTYDDLFQFVRQPNQEPDEPAVEEPEEDLLRFIGEHAPDLADWERDVVTSVRTEALYFQPQALTKVLNEGWASFWHARIIRELDLSDAEYHDFAEMNAGVLARAPMQLNPYFLGLKLLEDIERRWEKGGGEGRAKLFEVREMESDVSLIRNYLTQDLVEELDLYTYALRGRQWVIVEKDWEKVRDQLVEEVAGRGRPAIVAVSADYAGRRELHLRHVYRGVELDAARAEKTLRQLYHLWRRPVHLETAQGGRRVFLTYDGRQHSARSD
jgi:stage V sporulation protein R